MLKRLREDFRKYSWTLWLVIIFFLGGFVLPDLFTPGTAGKNDVLVVGKKKIRGDDFQKQLSMMLRRYNQQMNDKLNRNFIEQLGIPNQALNTLINSTIIQMVADQYRIKVSAEEVARAIQNSFSQDGRFIGKEQYEEIIRRNQMTVSDFEEDFKKDLRTNKLKEILTSGLTIGQEELYDLYQKDKEEAQLEYISVSPEYIKTDPPVTEAEIRKYYEEHLEEYRSPQKRKGDIVLFKYDDFKDQVAISDQEIADYYLAQKAQFREEGMIKVSRIFLPFDEDNREEVGKEADRVKAELGKVEDIKGRIEAFAERARKISGDDRASEGGDWGTMDWKSFTEQEVTTVNKLSMGEVSNVVGTDTGFSILMVTEKVPARTKPLNEVREVIIDTLSSERVENLVLNRAREVHERAENEGDLKKTAEEMGYPVITSDFVENRGGIADVDMTGRIASVFFNLDPAEISSPVSFYLGVALAQLREIKEPEQLQLQAVEPEVKNRLINEKKIKKLDGEIGDLYRQIARREDSDRLPAYLEGEGLNLSTQTYKPGGRFGSYTPFPGLDRLIFNIDTPLDDFLDPIRLDDDFVFIRIKSREMVDREDFRLDRELFYEEKLNELKDDYFASLIIQKRDEYKITFNKQLYDEIVEYELQRFK